MVSVVDILLLIYKDIHQWHLDTKTAATGGTSRVAFNYDDEDEAIATAKRYWANGEPFRMYDVTNPAHYIPLMTHRHLIVKDTRYANNQTV